MRYTSCTVEIDLFDTSAQIDGTLSTNDSREISDVTKIKETSNIYKLATTEDNYFLLDGTYRMYDDVENIKNHTGFMSKTNKATINVSFSKNHSSAGITFTFYEMLPKTITLTFKKDGAVIASEVFNPTKAQCKVEKLEVTQYIYTAEIGVENYDEIIMEFASLDRCIRINHIEYGIALFYGDGLTKKLKSCSLTEEVDVISTVLSANESKVEIIDMENMFRITNPSSYYRFLQRRQQFKITETIDDKEVFMASHYLKEWSQTKEHLASFTLQDAIGLMSDTTFYGGMYVNKSAYDLFAEIFNDYGFNKYEISNDVKDIKLTGHIKVCSHREALQQVAFACGACVSTSRKDGIHIFKPLYETVDFIDKDRKLISTEHKIEQNDLVTGVMITSHSYSLSSESKQVYKGNLDSGTHRVTFNNPCANLSITGGTIIQSNCNYADVSVPSIGEVIITGYEYNDSSVDYKYSEADELPSATNENVVSIKDATLISKSNVLDVAKLVYYIKQYRLEHNLKVVVNDEKVAKMYSLSVDGAYAPFLITKLETDLTGGYVSTMTGIGYALKIIDYYKTGTELYAGQEGII